jgi:transcription antitermination factor NusG
MDNLDDMGCSRIGWACVRTLPQHERRASYDIADLGFPVIFPRFTTQVRRYAKTEQQIRPLFPSYLFVQLSEQDDWSRVHRLPGRNRFLLGSHGRPAKLHDGEMEIFLATAPNGLLTPAPLSEMAPGVSVRNAAGVDWSGVCQWTSEARVGVLMTMFGAERVVTVARNQVVVLSIYGE